MAKEKTKQKEKKKQKKKKGRDLQSLIGITTFTKYGLAVGKSELLFYLVSPTNISAMEYLLGGCSGTLTVSPPIGRKPSTPFELPKPNHNMRRVFAYLLKHRGIDRDVLYAFTHKGMIYESADYHNAVFVGFDSDGVPRHAHKRGSGSESSYKGNQPGSDPRYSFHWHGRSEKIYLFEAPIDMLSFISMHKENWREHSYAASCGVSDQVLWQMMKDNPNIEMICLCRDNDEAGQTANKRTSDALFIKDIQHEILIPSHKDWNEDRLAAGGNAPHKEICAEFSIPEQEENSECTLQQVM